MINVSLPTKNLGWGATASLMGRMSGVGGQLAVTALLSRSLEPSAFGLWALLYTIYTLIPNFDLGLGQALRLKLAHLNAEGGQAILERRLFTSAVLILLAIGLAASAFAIGIIVLLNPNLSSVPTLIGFTLACGLTLCLNLAAQVFYAYGETIQRGLLDILQSVILLLVIWFFSRFQLSLIVSAYYMAGLAVGAFSLWMFVKRRNWKIEMPSLQNLLEAFHLLWKSSLWFWLLGMFAIGLYATSPLFVAHFMNLEQVGHFVILQRLFGVLTMFHLAWLNPLQSAYTQVAVLRNWSWVKRTWEKSLITSVVWIVLAYGVLLYLYEPLIEIWTGKKIVEPQLAFGLAAASCVWVWINTNSVMLNGLGIIKPQVALLAFGFLIFIILNITLIPAIGSIGAPISTLFAILPISVMNFIWSNRLIKEKKL